MRLAALITKQVSESTKFSIRSQVLPEEIQIQARGRARMRRARGVRVRPVGRPSKSTSLSDVGTFSFVLYSIYSLRARTGYCVHVGDL
jgi:hypothetical protein